MAFPHRRILAYQFTWRYKDKSPEPEQPEPSQQPRPSRRPTCYARRPAHITPNKAGPFRKILPRQIPPQQVALPCRSSGRPSFAETPRNPEPLRCPERVRSPEQTRYPEPHLSSHPLRSPEPPGSHEQTICPELPGSHERSRSPEPPKSSDRPGRSKQPKSPTRPLVCSTRHRAEPFRHLLPKTVPCPRVPIPRRIPERPSSPKPLRSLEQSLEQPAGRLESSERLIHSKRLEPPSRPLVYGNRRRAEPYPRLLPKALPRQRVPIPCRHKSTSKEHKVTNPGYSIYSSTKTTSSITSTSRKLR